jgi:hypothetical protein
MRRSRNARDVEAERSAGASSFALHAILTLAVTSPTTIGKLSADRSTGMNSAKSRTINEVFEVEVRGNGFV